VKWIGLSEEEAEVPSKQIECKSVSSLSLSLSLSTSHTHSLSLSKKNKLKADLAKRVEQLSKGRREGSEVMRIMTRTLPQKG
jgi:hypothetical protein